MVRARGTVIEMVDGVETTSVLELVRRNPLELTDE